MSFFLFMKNDPLTHCGALCIDDTDGTLHHVSMSSEPVSIVFRRVYFFELFFLMCFPNAYRDEPVSRTLAMVHIEWWQTAQSSGYSRLLAQALECAPLCRLSSFMTFYTSNPQRTFTLVFYLLYLAKKATSGRMPTRSNTFNCSIRRVNCLTSTFVKSSFASQPLFTFSILFLFSITTEFRREFFFRPTHTPKAKTSVDRARGTLRAIYSQQYRIQTKPIL